MLKSTESDSYYKTNKTGSFYEQVQGV